jgi:hypothetical protein
MAVNLSPVGGAAAQFFDNSGNVLTGGKLYTYAAGTTTPAVTYTQSNGITAHPNPIVLDAAGRVPDSGEIWLSDSILYKFVLKDTNDVQIAVWDNISGINSNFIAYATQNENVTATQGQTVFTLSGISYTPATDNLVVFVNGSKQVLTLNYIETSSTVVTFVDGLNVGDVVEFTTASPVATNVVNAANVIYSPAGTGAVNTNVQDKLREYVSVTDFGATGDGVTDDRAAIQEAVDYVQSIGGGDILFPPGTYILASYTTTVSGVAGEHISMVNYQNINFVGYGATLKSTLAQTAIIFYLDGCRNMSFEGFNYETPFVRTPGTATITTDGGAPFFLVANTRDSNSIDIENNRAFNVYWFLRVAETATSKANGYRVRGIGVNNVLVVNGYYGLNFANDGDLVNVTNFRLVSGIRTYFPYGVCNHDIQYTSTNNDYFTDCLIKAYDRDTYDIKVKCSIVGNTSIDAHCTIESQHDPVAQPVPGKLYNIYVDYDDTLSPATPTKSLRFAYFRNSTETATSSSNLFNNVTLRGNALKQIDFAVAVPANSCLLSIDQLTYDIANTANFFTKGFYSRYGQSNFINASGVITSNPYGVYNYTTTNFGNFAGNAVYGYADATIGLGVFRLSGEAAYPVEITRLFASGVNDLICTIKGPGVGPGAIFYEGGNSGAPNAANAVMKIGQMNVTARSINAAGTINASGADYAEYENNNGLAIAKGDIVGFKADGSLTLTFAEATRFGVKSTNPSYVGGDTWGSDEQPPAPPIRVVEEKEGDVITVVGDTDEEWQAKEDAYAQELAAFEARLEAKRQLVDRVAYSGKVPVNVTGANAGEYIVAVENGDGSIGGSAVANPTFEQYKLAVGRVNRILDDNRAEVAVIVH